ncbi:MAG: nucleotidyltransferase family protein [Candidatus Lokiarchaeota archaeon]|nr:nucleotidyltransferase family protein [Candidatus Lokiarchaeota archaeon]
MKAIILCAGLGKRLKPYTDRIQKTMLPLHGKPFLEYIINGMNYAGFRDIILVVGYRKEQIIDYFETGKKWNVNIEYLEQKELNGTGGALLLCEKFVPDNHFFLTWGDILVPYGIYKAVYDTYQNENHDFILVANYTEDPYLGAAIYCDDLFLTDIIEKPQRGSSKTNLNNCGVFIFSKEIFNVLKTLAPSESGEIEVPSALLKGIKERNWIVRVFKMEPNQFKGDIGAKEKYEQLKNDSSWLQLLKF